MTDIFETNPGFCPNCGSIFPQLEAREDVTCYNCKTQFPPNVFGKMEIEYTIHFNTYSGDIAKAAKSEDEPEGPLVERKCPKCRSNKMSYATAQLRSADEGQTVFFTCIKCKYKETENS